MWEYTKFIFRDIYESYMTFRLVDLAQPSFVLLWMIILFTPLIGIDRRDKFCSAMYALYLGGAGVTLVYALADAYIKEGSNLTTQFIATGAMMGFAVFRWYMIGNRQDQYTIVEKDPDTANMEDANSPKGTKKGKAA
jgi:hypothetical protein